jgi:hypothetical protein
MSLTRSENFSFERLANSTKRKLKPSAPLGSGQVLVLLFNLFTDEVTMLFDARLTNLTYEWTDGALITVGAPCS